MPRTLKVAAIQMDATPAPVASRLARAADLIRQAANGGAQLMVLPEVFNIGYEYTDTNYTLAEPLDGQTVTWMKAQAQQYHTHVMGSLLLSDQGEIYNAAILVAPDGRLWRYDKQYPWAMERAYFRRGDTIAIAETDLGKLGMMICWDSAHPNLWQHYAGKIDALLITSCPPKMSRAELVFPDGLRVNMQELGGVFEQIDAEEEFFPGVDMDTQTAWMGVPVVAAVGGGKFSSPLPLPWLSVFIYVLARPDLWWRVLDAPLVKLETGFDRQTKVLNPQGKVLARVEAEGDGFTLADITLADAPPQPTAPQPPMQTPPVAYVLSDMVAPALAQFKYQQQLHPQPETPARGKNNLVLLLIGALALFIGWRLLRRKAR